MFQFKTPTSKSASAASQFVDLVPLRFTAWLTICVACTLSGCSLLGSGRSDAGSASDASVASASTSGRPSAHRIALRIHAGQVLNTDPNGRSLALVLRVYALRGIGQFSHVSYPTFEAASAEKPLHSDDVISAKELVLLPGQNFEEVEPMPPEATHLAVVALFRSPGGQHWRFIFDARAAGKTGITLGAHACTLSVAVGVPVGFSSDELGSSGVPCS